MNDLPEVSIVIVSFNTKSFLKACLDSLFSCATRVAFEVIVVDNGSRDGSVEMLEDEYPQVRLLRNDKNEGYTRPMNQGLRVARGKWLVQLNPDTVVFSGTWDALLDFMEMHPEVGICTPKVLNRDGTLQLQCRRSAARPWDVVTYFTGLWRIFPKSKLFGGYLMTYKDENETHEAEAVSGSCMLIRRAVVDQIGYLDENLFAYQEDTEFCFRARQAGWKVYYVPSAQIIHYGGQGGSRFQPFVGIVAWHRSYYYYYHKHLASDYFFLINWFMDVAIFLKLAWSLLVNFLRKEKVVGTRKP